MQYTHLTVPATQVPSLLLLTGHARRGKWCSILRAVVAQLCNSALDL